MLIFSLFYGNSKGYSSFCLPLKVYVGEFRPFMIPQCSLALEVGPQIHRSKEDK